MKDLNDGRKDYDGNLTNRRVLELVIKKSPRAEVG